MWTWEEIHGLAKAEETSDQASTSSTPIRIIEQETHIMPNLKRMATSVPFDLVQPQDENGEANEVEGMDPNNLDALIEKLKRITDAAKKLNGDDDEEGRDA